MRIAIVDCETTGIGPSDVPITIAAIIAETDARGFATVVTEWYGEQFPEIPISPGAYEIHGRTSESLRGKAFDVPGLTSALLECDILIAHNASFDASMIARILPEIIRKEWRCSYKQWQWPRMENRKLDTACVYFGLDRPRVHDAMADARALLSALNQRTGKTSRSKTYLSGLLQKESWPVDSIAQVRPKPLSPSNPIFAVAWADTSTLVRSPIGARYELELHSDDPRGIMAMHEGRMVILGHISKNLWLSERLSSGELLDVVIASKDATGVNLDIKRREQSIVDPSMDKGIKVASFAVILLLIFILFAIARAV